MAHCVKVLSIKPDSLSLIFYTHIMEGENRLMEVVFLPPHVL